MATPQDCAPNGPRIDADLSDFVLWDPEVRFSPDDATKPRGAGVAVDVLSDSDALSEQLALEAAERARRKELFSDKQPWWSQAVNQARIPQDLFQSLERYTNIPFHGWFRRIEDALDDVEQASTDTLKELRELAQRLRGSASVFRGGNREERRQVQRLFETRLHDPEGARVLEGKLDPQIVVATDQLDGIYKRFFQQQGFEQADVDDFFKTIGFLRQKDGDFTAYGQGARIPKIMTSMEEAFRTGEIMLDHREWDFYSIGERLIRASARQKHLGPTWNFVKVQADALEHEGVASKELFNYFHTYLDQVRYAPDHWQIAMGRFMNKVTSKMFGKRLEGSETMDAVQWFLSTNYYVNMAWNTGVAIRNFLQPLVTSYPVLGERFTWEGYKAAVGASRNIKELNRYAKLGVITRDVEPIQANAIREAMVAAGPKVSGGTRANDLLNWVSENGWTMFRSAENVNRIMSYQGMRNRAEHFGKQFLSGKISWDKFYEASKLDSMDSVTGPITGQIRRVLESGDVEQASHLMGLQFTRNTQFVYRRGNRPYIMQGTMGSLLGQYGTWPAWYTAYMSNMAMRGSWQNRLTQMSRWGAANAAVLYAGSEVFGVEMSRWAFFSPLGYTGGPFVELSKDAMAAFQVATGSEDPVDRIQAARLKQAYTQVVPGIPWGATRNVRDSWKAMLEEDWATASKRFLGFQPVQEP